MMRPIQTNRTHRATRAPGRARKNRISGVLAVIVFLFYAAPSQAVDGVIEINQTRAEAGGVTPGDQPGFPVSLNDSGSYRLTSNLVVSDPQLDGIEILADAVTIDLNGFVLQGPLTCVAAEAERGNVVECTGDLGGQGAGIRSLEGGRESAVSNGFIRGFSSGGIEISPGQSQIEKVTVEQNGFVGIRVGENSLIRDCQILLNLGTGIRAAGGSIIRGSTIDRNNSSGLAVTSRGLIRDNFIRRNGGNGISAGIQSEAVNNVVSENGGTGIGFNGFSLIRDNVSNENGEFGIKGSGAMMVQSNTAIGNLDDGIQITGGAVLDNIVMSNGGDGIEVHSSSQIRGNTATGNDGYALRTTLSDSGMAGNQFLGNNSSGLQICGASVVEFAPSQCGSGTICSVEACP